MTTGAMSLLNAQSSFSVDLLMELKSAETGCPRGSSEVARKNAEVRHWGTQSWKD